MSPANTRHPQALDPAQSPVCAPACDPARGLDGDPASAQAASARRAAGLRRSRGWPAALGLAGAACVLAFAAGCTQERQNEIKRSIQNWTGTNGVLEMYAGDKLVRRFLKIDKLSTAMGTEDGQARTYRYGYGVLDENLNNLADDNEKRVYFEVSGFGNWIFFESPR